ncbi:alanine racemase [Rhodobacteraceae bacterium B1Z28]|uniref:Alanine racemase n=1 Tax=Ruegeria haliotis TaxID=2747601 RepID=A0ABX2PMQ1_9RHOB|nr:alanine racemase [Ruegeria haliotis]NVO54542.1 alanine racemase [Ruegeria haliotis]
MSDRYLSQLSETLRHHGVDHPIAVIDLDRLDANCRAALAGVDTGLHRRLVAKSLPCLPLLDHIRSLVPTSGLMTFSEPMLHELLGVETGTDHLIGKPLPVRSAARVLAAHSDAVDRVQWLIDTPERLHEYLTLSEDTKSPLRLSLELDIGLHRGGLTPDQVDQVAQAITTHPYARLSGVMGYEAHLAKLPTFLRSRANRVCAEIYRQAVAALPDTDGQLCLNTGGSLTFQSYSSDGTANEVAFGSVLVKPSDFDHAMTQDFQPAAFVATPILKAIPSNLLPGLEFLPRRNKTDIAVSGGHYLGQPVFPSGFAYSSIFGRSSNQEVWTGPASTQVGPGDIALIRPSQSEAVLNQFGSVLAVRGNQVIHEWPCLPN